jgi:hypothetical protein
VVNIPRALGPPDEALRPPHMSLFEWNAKFAQCVTFKIFIENINNVLTEGHFRIVNTESFQGIETDSMDPSRIALVQGRLTAAVDGPVTEGSRTHFCVKMQNMLSCLRNAHAQHFLDLSMPVGSTDVVLHVYEPQVNTYTPTFKLKTLHKAPDTIKLKVMDYKYLVEIDLQTFRNAIKTAKDHKADSIDLKVLTPKTSVGNRTICFFVIAYEADEVSSVFPYQSVTEHNGTQAPDAQMTIKASENLIGDYDDLPNEEDLNQLYCARFAVEYLFQFVKACSLVYVHTKSRSVCLRNPGFRKGIIELSYEAAVFRGESYGGGLKLI